MKPENMSEEKYRELIGICREEGMQNETLFILFWQKRFPDNSIKDHYVREWIQRFLSGNPCGYMDSISRKMYSEVINDM